MRALSAEELDYVSGGVTTIVVRGTRPPSGGLPVFTFYNPNNHNMMIGEVQGAALGFDFADNFQQFADCFKAETGDNIWSMPSAIAVIGAAVNGARAGATWGLPAGPKGAFITGLAGALAGAAYGALGASGVAMGDAAMKCGVGQ